LDASNGILRCYLRFCASLHDPIDCADWAKTKSGQCAHISHIVNDRVRSFGFGVTHEEFGGQPGWLELAFVYSASTLVIGISR
jgi:hypothetical protein